MSTEKDPKEVTPEQEPVQESDILPLKPKSPLTDPPACPQGMVWSKELKKCVPDVG